ncbi:biopolymer transporter ExbD [Permianibacter sp. IMCC34836]|uniref:ExbD/TolR family protein n=1 Tax=Permianibacter fluminis TaxID=2738515 RepID=UPI00155450CE|nr:biopolymer transporter ExbD [Permianibacter fluminis]NQD37629.1 biopolymer transporter ExbD [Permianibacter fluminis]
MLLERRRHGREDLNINLTPLIDVILTLIIFFMVSTRFNRDTQMQVNLPTAGAAPTEAALPAEIIEVTVDAAGNFFVNAKPLVNSQLNTLKSALQEVSNGNAELPMVISADGKAPYQAVATAMDAAGQLGFHKLTMAAQSPSEP